MTVALPTCNGEKYVRQALEGVLAQRPGAREVLVVDDQSTDRTLEIVREVGGEQVRVLVNEHRLGLAGNWHRCVQEARGEWVAVFHQDDVMLGGHLARHGAVIDRLGEARKLGMVTGPAGAIDDGGETVSERVVEPGSIEPGRDGADWVEEVGGGISVAGFEPGSFLNVLATRNPVRCSAVTLSKAAYVSVGGFDHELVYALDWEYWARLSRRYGVAWLLGPPSVHFRWHLESETHRFRGGLVDLEEQRQLLEGLFRNPPPGLKKPELLRKAAMRRLARAYVGRAYAAARAGDRGLQRRAIRRAVGCSVGTSLWTLLDPRVAARMAWNEVHPGRG